MGIPTNGFQVMAIIVFCCLLAIGGFVLGVMVTNAEYRRHAPQQDYRPDTAPRPDYLPVPAADMEAQRAAFYASQRNYPAPAAPVSLTVNVHPAAQIPTQWSTRQTVLNGEVIGELE